MNGSFLHPVHIDGGLVLSSVADRTDGGLPVWAKSDQCVTRKISSGELFWQISALGIVTTMVAVHQTDGQIPVSLTAFGSISFVYSQSSDRPLAPKPTSAQCHEENRCTSFTYRLPEMLLRPLRSTTIA